MSADRTARTRTPLLARSLRPTYGEVVAGGGASSDGHASRSAPAPRTQPAAPRGAGSRRGRRARSPRTGDGSGTCRETVPAAPAAVRDPATHRELTQLLRKLVGGRVDGQEQQPLQLAEQAVDRERVRGDL